MQSNETTQLLTSPPSEPNAGTHLILPPCVSLGRQNINRFSSPKNLRLMNSIRESCRSIEELDLGGNKLTDLIEVYKILQCTPNLRFLNLSENDLSRSSPVAMASSSNPTSSSSGLFSAVSPMISSSPLVGSHGQSWAFGQRACLAPINQNQQQHNQGATTIGARRHSTLGQSTTSQTSATSASASKSQSAARNSPLRARPTVSRVAEARRLAAANALAQSKKTSSIVANKLANSATAGAALAHHNHQPGASCRNMTTCRDGRRSPITSKPTLSRGHQTGHKTNTMHLARSLSSLSAKDVRNASNGSISRLTGNHRSSVRKELSSGARVDQKQHNSMVAEQANRKSSGSASEPSEKSDQGTSGSTKLTTSMSHQKLFVEPIVETDDVDMSAEQQLSPNAQSSRMSHQQQMIPTRESSQPLSATSSSALSTTTTPSTTSRSAQLQAGSNYSSTSRITSSGGTQSSSAQVNFRRTFESIKALALNNTSCQWRVVCSILSRMPNLEELHLSLNNYERIDLDPSEFEHHSLKRLYLCNNPKLTNWEELDKLLLAFPSLEALSIADCNISQIPDNLGRARGWRKLCGLNINGWPIKEWPVVERLNQLPSLVDLKCRNLEVLNTIDQPRHHLIARLPKLQRLNGSEIEEREDAEKAFLRFFMANSHLERPARFHELIQIHGEVGPVDVDVVDLSPPSQAHVRVIYLNRNYFCNENSDDILMSEDFLTKLMDNVDNNSASNVQRQTSGLQDNMDVATTGASSSAGSEQIDKEPMRLFKDDCQEVIAIDVDLRQSVRKFKSTIATLFRLDSSKLILYYIDHEMVGLMGPELIKHNQKKLWNYNVQDGDQFIIEER